MGMNVNRKEKSIWVIGFFCMKNYGDYEKFSLKVFFLEERVSVVGRYWIEYDGGFRRNIFNMRIVSKYYWCLDV